MSGHFQGEDAGLLMTSDSLGTSYFPGYLPEARNVRGPSSGQGKETTPCDLYTQLKATAMAQILNHEQLRAKTYSEK